MIIAIGALGGSGTKAVTEILIRSGVYMGDDLNRSNDNLVFTRLFKNPSWYKTSSKEEKNKRLLIFQKYMQYGKISINDIRELYIAANSNTTISSKSDFYFRILRMLLKNGERKNIWGWKEPNTQIYISEILNFFKNLKYIHVLRNGLDMAFSDNRQQLNKWGWKYNVNLSGNENGNELAIKQLNYWISSTKDVIEKSKQFENRFLLINYSNFYQNPNSEIDRMLKFLNIKVLDSALKKLYSIPKNTGSNNRYKMHDLSIFNDDQLRFVEKMGFVI